jgi:hypothetical protein
MFQNHILSEKINGLYNYFTSSKYDDDVKRVLLYNELKDFVMNHNYNNIHTFMSVYNHIITYKDLYEIILVYGDIDILQYVYQNYYIQTSMFIPFFTYLLNSVKNRENIEMYEFICKNYKEVKLSFHDLIKVMESKNENLLKLFINYSKKFEPNEEEYKSYITFDMKKFLKELEESNIDYIQLIFHIIDKSNYLQNLIFTQIGENVDFYFISKKKFIESIKEKIIENTLL